MVPNREEETRDKVDLPGSPAADSSDLEERGVRARARARLFGSKPELPRIGRFVVLEKLGEGGMGAVFVAYDAELDRKVAIKVLRATSAGPVARERMRREAQALAKLTHPNIVAIHDVGEWEGSVFLAMEFVVGRHLAAWATAERRTHDEVIEIYSQAARGLAAAHAAGLVHRDFKPENAILGDDGRVRVLDFGLARTRVDGPSSDGEPPPTEDPVLAQLEVDDSADGAASLTKTGLVMGTPAYMSPEQIEGHPADARTDQFSFCVALFEALHGRRPFLGASFAQLATAICEQAPGTPEGSDVPATTRAVLERGLAKDPADRFPTMEALLAALQRRHTVTRRRRVVALAAVGVAAVAVVMGVQEMQRRERVSDCRSAGEGVTEVWNEARRKQLETTMAAVDLPYATTVAEKTVPWIERWAVEWRSATERACLDHTVHATWNEDTYGRASDCLGEGRARLETLLEVLDDPNDEILRKATALASRLPAPDDCIDETKLALRAAPAAGQHEAAAAIRRTLAQASTASEVEDSERASGLLADALADAERLDDGVLMAETHIRLGELAGVEGKHADARDHYLAAFALAGKHDARPTMIDAALELAATTGSQEEDAELGHMWEAVAGGMVPAVEPDPGPRSLRLAEVAGQISYRAADYEDAQVHFQRAVELITRLEGPGHPALAPVMNNRAMAMHGLGKYEEALELLERVIVMYERDLGQDHPRVASTLSNLGWIYSASGRYETAAEIHQRSIDVWTKALGPDHFMTIKARSALADAHYRAGRVDEAIAMGKAAVAGMRESVGDEHPVVGRTLINLGGAQRAAGDTQGADASLREGVEVLTRGLGQDHPSVGIALNNYGNFVADQGELERAQELYRRSLDVFERGVGSEHTGAASPWSGVADVAMQQGDHARAVEAAQRALEIREKNQQSPLELAKARFRLARASWDAPSRHGGDRTQALTLARAALVQLEAEESSGELLAECRAWIEERSP